jgi:hypothetical protein
MDQVKSAEPNPIPWIIIGTPLKQCNCSIAGGKEYRQLTGRFAKCLKPPWEKRRLDPQTLRGTLTDMIDKEHGHSLAGKPAILFVDKSSDVPSESH